MSNGDALARLRDIHLPAPISWWPIAPGWYGLMVLVISLLLAGFLGWRFYRRGGAKREGLRLLLIYEKQAQQGEPSAVICAQVTELLRRVALAYFPRQDIAGLHGDAWIRFLNQTGKRIDFMPVRSLLLERPYQASASAGEKFAATVPQSGLQQRITVDDPLIHRDASPSPRVRGEGNKEGSDLEDLTPLFTLGRTWIKQRGRRV